VSPPAKAIDMGAASIDRRAPTIGAKILHPRVLGACKTGLKGVSGYLNRCFSAQGTLSARAKRRLCRGWREDHLDGPGSASCASTVAKNY